MPYSYRDKLRAMGSVRPQITFVLWGHILAIGMIPIGSVYSVRTPEQINLGYKIPNIFLSDLGATLSKAFDFRFFALPFLFTCADQPSYLFDHRATFLVCCHSGPYT